MIERGSEADFLALTLQESTALSGPAGPTDGERDPSDGFWASIDDDDTRDPDQLTVAEPLADGQLRIHVTFSDADGLSGALAGLVLETEVNIKRTCG